MADTRLVDAGQHILDTLVDGLTAEGIVVPERRFLHTGEIAYDFVGTNCGEAFIVSWAAAFQGGLGEGGEGVNPIRCSMPLSAQFTIALLRCVPTVNSQGKAPTAEALDASGENLMIEAWTLNKVIVEKAVDKTLIQLPIVDAAIGGSLPVGPDAALGGVTVQLFVGIL